MRTRKKLNSKRELFIYLLDCSFRNFNKILLDYEVGILFFTKKKILYKAHDAAKITGRNVSISFISIRL